MTTTPSMASATEEQFQLSNLARFYMAEYEQMVHAFEEGNFDKCYNLADELLENADLPIFTTAGCHLFLADRGYDGIRHAEEALRLYQEMANLAPDSESHRTLVLIAERTLARAKEHGDREYTDDEDEDIVEETPAEELAAGASSELAGEGNQALLSQHAELAKTLPPSSPVHQRVSRITSNEEKKELETPMPSSPIQQGTKRAAAFTPPSSRTASENENKKARVDEEDSGA